MNNLFKIISNFNFPVGIVCEMDVNKLCKGVQIQYQSHNQKIGQNSLSIRGNQGETNFLKTKVQSICGDGRKAETQSCDNGNQIGCSTNCVPDIGYSCTGAIGSRSVCNTICGDGILAENQLCDNANIQGCINCRVASGYTCYSNGISSVCRKI